MRQVPWLLLLLLASCAEPGPATQFRNPTTGEVVAACGPFHGLAIATTLAEEHCTKAYEAQGWVRLPPPQ